MDAPSITVKVQNVRHKKHVNGLEKWIGTDKENVCPQTAVRYLSPTMLRTRRKLESESMMQGFSKSLHSSFACFQLQSSWENSHTPKKPSRTRSYLKLSPRFKNIHSTILFSLHVHLS